MAWVKGCSPPSDTSVRHASSAQALGESKNGEKCVIDGPQLVCRQISDPVAKSLDVNGSELFDKDVGRVAGNGYLGSKRGGSGAT